VPANRRTLKAILMTDQPTPDTAPVPDPSPASPGSPVGIPAENGPGVTLAAGTPAPMLVAGAGSDPNAHRVTFQPSPEDPEKTVLLVGHPAWMQIVETVPSYLRTFDAITLFEKHVNAPDGAPAGFFTAMGSELMAAEAEEEEDPEKAARKREAAQKAFASIDQMMGQVMPQPGKYAVIPVGELPMSLHLVALARCDTEGLMHLAKDWAVKHPQQGSEAIDEILQHVPQSKTEIVFLLRLLGVLTKRPSKSWLEFRLAGRWYGVPATVDVALPYQFASALEVEIQWRYRIGASSLDNSTIVEAQPSNQEPLTLQQLLAKASLRVLALDGEDPTTVLDDFTRWRQQHMYQTVDVEGECVQLVETNAGLRAVECPPLDQQDALVIVDEPEAWRRAGDTPETDEPYLYGGAYEVQAPRLAHPPSSNVPLAAVPIVRFFSLRRKTWLYADYRNLARHEWADGLLESVVLPEDYRESVERVARSLAVGTQQAPDILPGRHGGIVILEEGPTGTGKTATAEALAQTAKRPVYEVSAWDLVETADSVMQRRQRKHGSEALEPVARVFDRASRWNAVLLVDEADVLFSHRDSSDLGRSALVGRFLHLAETFEGVLILTTNLPGSIDPAVVSRCSLVIPYVELDASGRKRIWDAFFDKLGLDYAKEFSEPLSQVACNGRQIRSAVRMALIGRENPGLEQFQVALKQTMPRFSPRAMTADG